MHAVEEFKYPCGERSDEEEHGVNRSGEKRAREISQRETSNNTVLGK